MFGRAGREGTRMGKMKESPRYNIISVRVTDEQLLRLQRLLGRRQTTVSELVREALERLDLPFAGTGQG